MQTPQEGQRVSYIGDGGNGLAVGDRGKVLSTDDQACHVLWTTGALAGEITFHTAYDLAANGQPRVETDMWGDALVSTAVADTYARRGKDGLLDALADEGHLSTFAQVAEEAIQMVAGRIRQDPSFQEVLGSLDPEEGDEFVAYTAYALLRDAFGEEPE